jgi:hypothetical protein
MTDNELKELVASLAVFNKELRDSQKETGRKLDKVAKMIGGISANQGDVTEDFFYNSFIKDNRLGKLSFDDITKNMSKHRGKTQEEYDIFLTNGGSIAIIEVKYKAHIEDIKKLERKFNNFKTLFPIYKGMRAAFLVQKDSLEIGVLFCARS